MKKPKVTAQSLIVIILAMTVLAATIIYLFTDKMIPGLIPLCTAVMMVPMWHQQKQNKTVAVLCLTAAVLNVIAGVMQIIAVFLP